MNTTSVVQKIWSYCDVLRDVGVSYGDYLEQLTYLLFLKMADEYAKPPYKRDIGIPKEYTWPELKKQRGAALETFYVKLLRELGSRKECWARYSPSPRTRSRTRPCSIASST